MMPNYNLSVLKADIYPGFLQTRVTDGLNEVEHIVNVIAKYQRDHVGADGFY